MEMGKDNSKFSIIYFLIINFYSLNVRVHGKLKIRFNLFLKQFSGKQFSFIQIEIVELFHYLCFIVQKSCYKIDLFDDASVEIVFCDLL